MDIIPLQPYQMSMLGYALFTNVGGILLNALLVFIYLNLGLYSGESILIFNLILCDLLFCLTALGYNSINVGHNINQMSFEVCQITGILVTTFHSMAVFTLLMIAFYHYYIIVLKMKPPSPFLVGSVLASNWALIITLCLVTTFGPFDITARFRLESVGYTCSLDFVSRKPLAMTINSLAIFVMLTTPLNLLYMYSAVWQVIRIDLGRSARDMPILRQAPPPKLHWTGVDSSLPTELAHTELFHVQPRAVPISQLDTQLIDTELNCPPHIQGKPISQLDTELSPPRNEINLPTPPKSSPSPSRLGPRVTTPNTIRSSRTHYSPDKIVLKRAILITTCYLLFVLPLGIVSAMELVTGVRSDPLVSGIVICLVTSNQIANPLLFFILDQKLRREFTRLMYG